MKVMKYTIKTAPKATFFAFLLFAFTAANTYGQGAFGEPIKSSTEKVQEKIKAVTGESTNNNVPPSSVNNNIKSPERPTVGRTAAAPMHKKVYSIVLFSSDNPIDTNHEAFKLYSSDLFFRQIPNEAYYYMVGQYQTEEAAKLHLERVKMQFPAAEIVNDIDYPHLKF
jgi:hypothetical protein